MKQRKPFKPFTAITFSHVCMAISVAFGALLLVFLTACILRFLPVSRVEIIDSPYERFDMMDVIEIREGKDRWWDVDTKASDR